jgi:hypothetical protein
MKKTPLKKQEKPQESECVSDYIWLLDEDTNVQEYEDAGFTVYTKSDTITHYGVEPGAPEEAHHLASGAALGDPVLIDELMAPLLARIKKVRSHEEVQVSNRAARTT